MAASLLFVLANLITGVTAAVLVMSPKYHIGPIATTAMSALSFSCLSVVAWAIRGYEYKPYTSSVIIMVCLATLVLWRLYRLWKDGV